MSESKPIRILYMEDDPGLARPFKKGLEQAGYVVDIARDGEEGLTMYVAGSYDVVAVDQNMPVYTGLEVINIMASQGSLPPMIMVTGTGSERIAVEAMKLGAGDYLVKDVDGGYLDLLPTVIEQVLQQWRLVEEKQQAEEERERLLVAEREQRLLAETLAEVTLAITSLTSHEAVLDEILRQVQRIVPYSAANIALWEGNALRVAHWRGYETFGGEELISSLVQTLDDITVDLDVIQSRQPLVIPDTGQEPRWVVLDETAWIRSYLVVPICLHDRVLGLLRLDSDTPGEFSAEDGERLRPLANAAAIAMENARLFGEVQRLATTDGLTGIYNRRHFFELAEHELSRARRYGHPVSAIMLDVDHFKQVNDTYGHAAGDQVLRAVAERCGDNIRDIDILGRYGGEEFAIILPATDLTVAQIAAERLRRCIADVPVPTDKGDLTVTISLGVASSAQDDEDVAALLNRADAAMYAAKQAGRNRVVVA
ncbi:MAG: diguanylate cyclase [Chloroflexi bacterium]|nr:diguanylate cyclase [Chloroflexota bacterium]